jgi:hypothetical protein
MKKKSKNQYKIFGLLVLLIICLIGFVNAGCNSFNPGQTNNLVTGWLVSNGGNYTIHNMLSNIYKVSIPNEGYSYNYKINYNFGEQLVGLTDYNCYYYKGIKKCTYQVDSIDLGINSGEHIIKVTYEGNFDKRNKFNIYVDGELKGVLSSVYSTLIFGDAVSSQYSDFELCDNLNEDEVEKEQEIPNNEVLENNETIPNEIITNDYEEVCIPDWECEKWKSCSNGIQKRSCEDLNDCNTNEDKPKTKRSCETKEDEELTNENITPVVNNNSTSIPIVLKSTTEKKELTWFEAVMNWFANYFYN